MRVLSLFDGMACGMLAMLEAGVKVDRYVAYEYDESTANASKGRPYGFAAFTASHNFPMIEQMGNVFNGDFTEFQGFDFLIGGSPCTYWSIAQKNNRETEASGMGWELFSQYVRALKEAKPMYFIYENNKSMSKAIRQSITDAFGFEPICINSSLVSAQNRQRLYWVGKRHADGTYRKVEVEQPKDRGVLLKDILESSTNSMVAEPVNITPCGKSQTIKAQYHKNSIANICCYTSTYGASGVAELVKDAAILKHNGELSTSAGGKVYTVYEIKGGKIAINGKQYPIKLPDGFYIIRKLSVVECMKLQTVPEWYEFPVSNNQAYKMLGNGWTVSVISYLIKGADTV